MGGGPPRWRYSLGRALRDAFRKLRRFLMTKRLSEAISLMSTVADFGVTQVVDINRRASVHE